MLSSNFPSWNTGHYYSQKWSREDVFEEINDVLRKCLCYKQGRRSLPSVGLFDSQSVKTTRSEGEEIGVYGSKNILKGISITS
ncbi:MAG: hypothetical protein SNG27_04630 [Rikenellaceae bacterium]